MAEAMKRAGECPDLESIAAHLDNRLSAHERARMTEHLASCEECYAVFREAAQTDIGGVVAETEGSRERWMRWSGRKLAWASTAAALATAASLWLVIGTGVIPWRPADRELRALVAAVGTDRPIEARLTGGFAYGELPSPMRGGTPGAPAASPEVRMAAANAEKVLAARNSPDALHTLGVASIVVGDLDRAIPMIERAVSFPPPNPRYLTDLAAAYLARAARDSRHQDLVKALAVADRAVKPDPALAEALFNRALALDQLGLVEDARGAWQEYLRADADSGWAEEARQHLRRVQ
ncbi:MAG TPA: zf-HC2 domain-containing protein [Vicinamibacterales bacterium]|nr:zf-HC2 domain-containing protein [Vicinamibacterales bacterium]